MAIKWKHNDWYRMYFCTFTCFKWLPLFKITNGYSFVYDWFDVLKSHHYQTVAFVIMPNHVHSVLYFAEPGYNLNKIIGNGKRFIAYSLIDQLEKLQRNDMLLYLSNAVTDRERNKGQLHKVFTDSFDAKGIYSEKFFNQKINYIHRNPVSGKWNLVKDYTEYEHSSASYYELGIVKNYAPFDFRLL